MAFRSLNAAVRNSQGIQTNPTTATVLADTGAVAGGLYDVKIIVGSSVAATFEVQVRDSANAANVGSTHIVYVAAGQSAQFVLSNVGLNPNERVRVLPQANITGTAAANVFVHRAA